MLSKKSKKNSKFATRLCLKSYLNWALFGFVSVFVSTASLFFFACNAGLGNQVDTGAPKVTISSPSTKSTLNSSFTLKGTASDDLCVANVEVLFSLIGSTKTYGPFSASLSGNDWTYDVPLLIGGGGYLTGASLLPDGDYNVTVSATDKSGHISTTDVVYTIDTTSPTVLLTSPTTYATSPQFSQTITIKGEVYDATTLSSVYVYLYDYEGNIVAQTLAEGTNTFIATFTNPTDVFDYDNTNDETKAKTTYYYAAVATDAGGNQNTYDFHRCDIANLVAKYEGSSFPSINAIGSLDQGKSSSITGGITANDIAEKHLAIPSTSVASEILAQRKYPCLRYTKSSNGSITWLNVSERGNDTIKTIDPANAVYGTVNPSIDGSSQSGFRVWVKKLETDADGPVFTTTNDAGETVDIDIEEDSDGDGIGDNEITVSEDSDDEGNFQAYFTSDGSGSFSFTINSGDGSNTSAWQTGYWWIRVYYVTDTGGYGEGEAVFNAKSGSPIITETAFAGEDNANYTNYTGYRNTKPINLAGKATDSDGSGSVDKVIVSWKSSSGSTDSSDGSTGSCNATYDKTNFEWSYTFEPQEEETYTITITATVGDNSSSVYRTVLYDATSPEIELKSVVNEIEVDDSEDDSESETYYVNGSIDITFNLSDEDQITSASCVVLNEDESEQVNNTYNSSVKKIVLSDVDTTSFKDGKTLADYICVKASDRAGNSIEYTGDTATELKKYIVNQTSDKPTLTSELETLSSREDAVCDEDGVEHNIFKKSESISLVLKDDDGLYSIEVKVDGDTDANATWVTTGFTNADFNSCPTSKTVKYSLSSLSYGKHSLKFRIKDINSSETDSGNGVYESPYFYLTIDSGVPTMNISTLLNQNVSSVFTIEGTAKDENGIEKIEFISVGTTSEGTSDNESRVFYTITPSESDDTTTDWAWSQSYNLESAENEVHIKPYPDVITVKITDKIGRIATSTFSYYYDSFDPEVPVFVDDVDALFYGLFIEGYVANTTNSLTITGKTSDTGSGSAKSGISKVQWGLLDGKFDHTSAVCVQNLSTGVVVYYDSLYALMTDPSSASTTITQTGVLNDKWYYYAAGMLNSSGNFTTDNSSATSALYFCYHYEDDVAQNIVASLDSSSESITVDGVTYTKKIEWTDATLTLHSATSESDTYDYDWKIYTSFPEFSDGEYTIVIRSVDKVGNTSYPLIHYILADNTAPSITVGTSLENATSDSSETLYTQSSATLTGKITENNPLILSSGLEYIRSQLDEEYKESYALNITCKDSSGNEVSTGTLSIYGIDSEKPKWPYEQKVSWAENEYSWLNEFENEGVYTVTISTRDKAYYDKTPVKNSTTLSRNIVVDKTAPIITLSSVSPLIEYNGNDTVNGSTTVSVLVQDSNIESAYVTYKYDGGTASDIANFDASDSSKYDWQEFTSTQLISGWTGEIDTTNSNYYYTVSENGEDTTYLSLAFKAVDKAGNVTYLPVVAIVDQESDRPTITATNLYQVESADDAGWTIVNSQLSSKNVFTSSNKTINFNLTDDDGLQAVYVAHGEQSINENTSWTLAENLDGSTSKLWSYTLPSDYFTSGGYGKYILNFKVVDLNYSNGSGNATSETSYATYYTYIATDDGSPTLVLNNKNTFVPQTLTLSGTVKDANGLEKIDIIYPGSDENDSDQVVSIDLQSETAGSEVSWSQEITLLNDSGTIYVYAYDKIGNRSVASLVYSVDSTPPVVTLEDDSDDDDVAYVDYGYVDSSKTLSIKGVLTDPTTVNGSNVQASGISGVKYEITSSENHDEWTSSTGSDAYTFNAETGEFLIIANFTDLQSTTQYIHIAGCDVAGNWSNIAKAKVTLDTQIPQTTLSAYYDNEDDGSYTDEISSSIFTKTVHFKGSASDDGILSTLKVYNYNSGSISDDKLIGSCEFSGSAGVELPWEIAFEIDSTEHSNDGSWVILFRLTDASGKYQDYTETYSVAEFFCCVD